MDLTFFAILIMSVWVIAIVAAGLVLALRPGGATIRLAPATAPAAGPRDEILLGGPAEVLGNFRGRVRAVLVDPKTRKLAAIRLATGLEDEDIPAGAILGADGHVLRLAEAWPETSPDGTDSASAVLRDGMPVAAAEGKRMGRLRLVKVASNSGTVEALIIDRSDGPRLVPFDRVTEVGPDRIVTSTQAVEQSSLQWFATDWEIRQGILAALSGDPALQPVQRSLRFDVADQKVRLSGYVSDRAQAQQVERAVDNVPGVLHLDLNLITDDDLAAAVMDAIKREASAVAPSIRVTARTGIVEIAGQVPDRSTARRIEAVARQVAGVQGVRNAVAIRPATAAAS